MSARNVKAPLLALQRLFIMTVGQALPIGTLLALETSAHRLRRLYW